MPPGALSFPIGFVLIPFGLFLLFYALYALFNLRNLFLAGVPGPGVFAVCALFIVGSFGLFGSALYAFSTYDLASPVQFDGIASLLTLPRGTSPHL